MSWCTLVTACTDMLIEPALQHSINAPACSNASLSHQFLPSYRWSRYLCCRTQELMLSPFRIDKIAPVLNQSRRVSARSADLHFHFKRDYRERQNTHWIHKRGNTPLVALPCLYTLRLQGWVRMQTHVSHYCSTVHSLKNTCTCKPVRHRKAIILFISSCYWVCAST